MSYQNKEHNANDHNKSRRAASRSAFSRIIIMSVLLSIILATTNFVLRPFLPASYLRYLHVAEIAVAAYFVIQIIANITYKLTFNHSEDTAKSIRSLIRITGAIIVIAFIISYLSQDPIIAASISTISGLVIGFAASSLIGNVIAGIYLAIARPFRIDDCIKVFGETGTVLDIGLLYTRIMLQNGDSMLASNSSMVTTNIILKKKDEDDDDSASKPVEKEK